MVWFFGGLGGWRVIGFIGGMQGGVCVAGLWGGGCGAARPSSRRCWVWTIGRTSAMPRRVGGGGGGGPGGFPGGCGMGDRFRPVAVGGMF